MPFTFIQDKELVAKAIEEVKCPSCDAEPTEPCKQERRLADDNRRKPFRGHYSGSWYVHQPRYELVAPPEKRRVRRVKGGHMTDEELAKRLYNVDLAEEGISRTEAPWASQPERVHAEYVKRAKKERENA